MSGDLEQDKYKNKNSQTGFVKEILKNLKTAKINPFSSLISVVDNKTVKIDSYMDGFGKFRCPSHKYGYFTKFLIVN